MNLYEWDQAIYDAASLPLKTNMLGGQLKAGQSLDPQLEPLLFTPLNFYLSLRMNLDGIHSLLQIRSIYT